MYTYIAYFTLLFQCLLILSFCVVIADGWLQACWKCIWLMQHLSTAHGLPKLRQRSTRSCGGWQTFQFQLVKRKQTLIFPPEFTENYYTFLLQLQFAFVIEAKLTKLLHLHLKVCRQLLAYLTGKKEKKIKWFKKKCGDSKVNLLKQLFFSSLNSLFQGDQINSKLLPLLHHNVFATS